jgi:uncharacterized membrane protein YtjA (UPF0391 family)
MLEHLLLIVQEGNVEQNDLSELFSLGTGVFALILLVISLVSYRKVKLTRLLFVSAAFGLFAVKTLIEHADLLFPGMDTTSFGGTLLVFLDFMILLLIFLSIARR